MTPDGELEIHLDTCDGAKIAGLPMPKPVPEIALATARASAQTSVHDLCLVFTRCRTYWALHTVAPAGPLGTRAERVEAGRFLDSTPFRLLLDCDQLDFDQRSWRGQAYLNGGARQLVGLLAVPKRLDHSAFMAGKLSFRRWRDRPPDGGFHPSP
jgi:hypothetical protein